MKKLTDYERGKAEGMAEAIKELEIANETIRVFAEMCQEYNQAIADGRDVLKGVCSTTVDSWIKQKREEAISRLKNRK